MAIDWTTVFEDSDCPSGHEFPKHTADGTVWCPDCGQTIRPDTFNEDLPGILDGGDDLIERPERDLPSL